ncbi:predicted protein [Naegleria gruberi]|uniref:Predicted protein n=1 Tax=Naegleria gruberi TaxID=5762 RepID=D2VXT1_NAEGR|nr:uncharacterized protein NAEGRDRAFT_59534 [Naegleria gruberi]EFC38345.1 predicted protein [Naegleria gruberi]|eukprot:XP_002671089.1 predicted protein [Naegleria gruberi strain NEG-M]
MLFNNDNCHHDGKPFIMLAMILIMLTITTIANASMMTINSDYKLPNGGFSFKFELQERSGKLEKYHGTTVRYQQTNGNAVNLLLESATLGFGTFFDSTILHTFLKPILGADGETMTECLHLNYDSPWNSGVEMSKMLDLIVFKKVSQMEEFTLRDDSKKVTELSSHEKFYLDRLDGLMANCTFYDRKWLQENMRKETGSQPNTAVRQFMEKYIQKYKFSGKINAPILQDNIYKTSHQLKPINTRISLWFQNEREACVLAHIRDESACKRMMKSNENKPTCIFLHGAGYKKDLPPQKTLSDYWGNVADYVPQCGDVWFGARDTKNFGWDDENLQKYYCETALLGSGNSSTIKNTIIYSHSMGNLILAAAFKNGICDIDLSTSEWYTIGSPFNGSLVSRTAQSICYDYYYDNFKLNKKGIVGWVITLAGYCIKGTPDIFPSYASVEEGYCSPKDGTCIHDLYQFADPYDKGRMCGDTPIGLITHYSIALELVHLLADLQYQSDGFVTFPACQMDEAKKFTSESPNDLCQIRSYSITHTVLEENKDGNRGQNNRPQQGGKPFVKKTYNNNNSQQGGQQGGENRPYYKKQYNNNNNASGQAQSTHNKRPYMKPKPQGTTPQQTSTSTTNTTTANTTNTSAAPKRIVKKDGELLKEAQKLKELQKKIKNEDANTSSTEVVEAPLEEEEGVIIVDDAAQPTQKIMQKRALSEEIEKQEYLMRLEGKKKKPSTSLKIASNKKKGARKQQRKKEGQSEEGEEGKEFKGEFRRKKKGEEEEEEDVLKTDIELNQSFAETIDRIYTGFNPELVHEQLNSISKRGFIPAMAEIGAESGANFAPLMKQILTGVAIHDEAYHNLMRFVSNYQALAQKVLDSMEDKERADSIREIYPFLGEGATIEIDSNFDVNEFLKLNPDVRMNLVQLFDPDYFTNLEAVESKAAKDLETLANEGKLTRKELDLYKQEISTSLLAEKLLNYFNSKLFSLQLAGVSDFFLQQETVKELADHCFDTIVRKRGSAVVPFLPEAERNFIEEREANLGMKYGITRENLHTFVGKESLLREGTYQSLNGRIEELLSKKRVNTIAIENRLKIEQPSDDFDNEDEYYYGDEQNPVEAKEKRANAVNSMLADFKYLPLKSHVSAIRHKIKQRLYHIMKYVYEPKLETIPYIRDIPFTSGQYHHAGKTGSFAKFAPIERNFDEIIESSSSPDSIARIVLINYSRALGQNDTIDMKSKMSLMHRFGSFIKTLDEQGDLIEPVALNNGKRTHIHPNRVNPRDAELDLKSIHVNEPEEHWFWKYMEEASDKVDDVISKRLASETKRSDIGRGGKPKVKKVRSKK